MKGTTGSHNGGYTPKSGRDASSDGITWTKVSTYTGLSYASGDDYATVKLETADAVRLLARLFYGNYRRLYHRSGGRDQVFRSSRGYWRTADIGEIAGSRESGNGQGFVALRGRQRGR